MTESAKLFNPPSVTKSSDLTTAAQAALKVSGIKQLKPPGSDSNYINWKFVVGIHLRATKVIYVLEPVEPHLCPDSWPQDNTAVCSVLTRTSHLSNFCHIQDFKDDAAGMWAALKAAHQDSLSGGRMYWLRKLIQTRMGGNDINAHIEQMGNYAEKLNALITPANPLTPDDIHSTCR
jgi:hypothetical protein